MRGGRVKLAALQELAERAPAPFDERVPVQGYVLDLQSDQGARLTARDEAGDFYGRQTLRQWIALAEQLGDLDIPACVLRDSPSRLRRGVMFDVSRGKVPTLETLKAQIERLVRCKCNEVQLYFEHTFAYTGAEDVWKNASPYTAADMLELDAFCRARHVDLVPNQQSFGHLHRWLTSPEFQHLAELPEGIDHAFSLQKEPYGLCATDPASLTFLEGLYDELLPNFSSTFFHVGLDETIDLGLGPSKARCDEVGKARVHLEFLLAVNDLVRARGRRMMYWADEQEKSVELRRELPRDAVACVWGYEAGDRLLEKSRVFAEEGLDLVVCPGTSSWQSFGGRSTNLFTNLREATEAAEMRQALGMLVCDWGDRGHFQPYAIAERGWTLGVGLAWNATSTDVLGSWEKAAALVSTHAFEDATGALGRWLHRLGRIDELAGGTTTNGASLFFTVFFADEPFPHERTPGLNLEGLTEARAELKALALELLNLHLPREDGELLRRELGQVVRLLEFACRLAAARIEAPEGSSLAVIAPLRRRELAEELKAVLEDSFGALWLERNRIGGMADSKQLLERTWIALQAD